MRPHTTRLLSKTGQRLTAEAPACKWADRRLRRTAIQLQCEGASGVDLWRGAPVRAASPCRSSGHVRPDVSAPLAGADPRTTLSEASAAPLSPPQQVPRG